MRRLLFLLPALLFLCAGCAGYQIGPAKPKRYEAIHNIAISNFANDTLEPRIEVQLANILIKQIQQDGTYRVTDEAHADAILEGRLERLDRRGAQTVNGNVLLAREYTLTLRARYSFRMKSTGVVLDERPITGSTNFFVTGSSVIAADVNQDERQAIPLAMQDLAVHITAQISEGW